MEPWFSTQIPHGWKGSNTNFGTIEYPRMFSMASFRDPWSSLHVLEGIKWGRKSQNFSPPQYEGVWRRKYTKKYVFEAKRYKKRHFLLWPESSSMDLLLWSDRKQFFFSQTTKVETVAEEKIQLGSFPTRYIWKKIRIKFWLYLSYYSLQIYLLMHPRQNHKLFKTHCKKRETEKASGENLLESSHRKQKFLGQSVNFLFSLFFFALFLICGFSYSVTLRSIRDG